MVGGDGIDQLYGAAGADLVYGGDIDAFLLDQEGLFSVWMNWSSTGTQQQAFDDLTGALVDDETQDTLNGEGDSDWYITHINDFIKASAERKKPNEQFPF